MSRSVVPVHFPGSQRCRKHPDRIAHQIRLGRAMCEECVSERDRQLFRENFYGPPPDPDVEALRQRLEVVESKLQHQPPASRAAANELIQFTKLQNGTTAGAEGTSPDRPPDYEKCELAWQYDKDLRRIRHASAGGKIYGEDDWRRELPNLPIWDGIDESHTLRPKIRKDFFSRSLARCRLEGRFEFIGQIMGVSSDQAYRWYKQYRKYEGITQTRRARSPRNMQHKPNMKA